MPTIGVAIAIPEPWASELQDYRTSVGDTTATQIPTHITLIPPSEVDERELVVGAVGDAEDAATGRVGDGRRDRDLLTAQGVDERRLADVRTAGNRDEPGSQGHLLLGHPIPPPTASVTRKCVRVGNG